MGNLIPPTAGIFDEPQMSICLNVEWAGHIDGALSRLLHPSAWDGATDIQQWAIAQITALLVSMIARNPCGGEEVPDLSYILTAIGSLADDLSDVMTEVSAMRSETARAEQFMLRQQAAQRDTLAKFLRDKLWVDFGEFGLTIIEPHLGSSVIHYGDGGYGEDVLFSATTAFVYWFAQLKTAQLQSEQPGGISIFNDGLLLSIAGLSIFSPFAAMMSLTGTSGLRDIGSTQSISVSNQLNALASAAAIEKVICAIVAATSAIDAEMSNLFVSLDSTGFTADSNEDIVARLIMPTFTDNWPVFMGFLGTAYYFKNIYETVPVAYSDCSIPESEGECWEEGNFNLGTILSRTGDTFRVEAVETGFAYTYQIDWGDLSFDGTDCLITIEVVSGEIEEGQAYDRWSTGDLWPFDLELNLHAFRVGSVSPFVLDITISPSTYVETWEIVPTDAPYPAFLQVATPTHVEAASSDNYPDTTVVKCHFSRIDGECFTVTSISIYYVESCDTTNWIDCDDVLHTEPIEAGDIVKEVLYENSTGAYFQVWLDIV